MRNFLVALSLACALSMPAIATNWGAEIDGLANRWAAPNAPQSQWRSGADETSLAGGGVHRLDPIRAFTYAGSGWSTLDGWMRGDPLLRQWVLHRFDADGDGMLSINEAAMARQVFYTLADSNRSGIITSEEFLNGWGTVRAAIFDPYALAG